MNDIIDLEARRQAKRAEQEGGYTCVLAFDCDDGPSPEEFVRGFEAGRLYSDMASGRDDWLGSFHSSNRVMIERIAKLHGYDVVIEETEDPAWISVQFNKRSAP